jgi:hypothetical protein
LLTHCITQAICFSLFLFEYQGNPVTLEEHRPSTEHEIFIVPSYILQSVVSNFVMGLQNIISIWGNKLNTSKHKWLELLIQMVFG